MKKISKHTKNLVISFSVKKEVEFCLCQNPSEEIKIVIKDSVSKKEFEVKFKNILGDLVKVTENKLELNIFQSSKSGNNNYLLFELWINKEYFLERVFRKDIDFIFDK